MIINDKKFVSFLKSLKIKEDYIILHVKLINHRHLIQNIDNFWINLSKGLGNDKTFIVPTLNLNFVRTKIWDKKKSKSKSGYFSEYFRKNITKFLNTNHYQVLEKIQPGNGFVNQKMYAIFLLV